MRTEPTVGEVLAWTAAGIAAALGLLLLMLAAQSAFAHGPAEWIQNGGYKKVKRVGARLEQCGSYRALVVSQTGTLPAPTAAPAANFLTAQ